MFYEYALVPDIFDVHNYSSAAVFAHCLNPVKEAVLDNALVRDLNNSQWSQYIKDNLGRWHPKAKELIRKIQSQNRLRAFKHAAPHDPYSDLDWAVAANASHQMETIDGIIISNQNANQYSGNRLFSNIEQLSSATFWQNRRVSKRLNKTMVDYLAALNLILECSNSLMFIDFFNFIAQHGNSPVIEIHRVGLYTRDNHGSPVYEANEYWERTFKREWEPTIQSLRLELEVFIWDNFHDRYLISNLVGISVPYGFDTSNQAITTTWTKLSRQDRDEIQREFDPASNSHVLRHRFKIN